MTPEKPKQAAYERSVCVRTAERYHDFSYGHRVVGHESKCQHGHGHNGRVHFTVEANCLDTVGRVIDFGEIGRLLCQWVETNWDHKNLIYVNDPWLVPLTELDHEGIVAVPFNPTAENIAEYLVKVVGPEQLKGTGAVLTSVKFEETRKCSATYQMTETVRMQSGLMTRQEAEIEWENL